MNMTRIIGLTGGIASGKSTVSKLFKDEGIPVIDSDQIAHDLLEKGTPVYDEIIHHFSSDILLSDQSINRKKLAKKIFGNHALRDTLNGIVHPHVYRIIESEIRRYKDLNAPFIVLDIPLLFETGYDAQCDETIVVYTDIEHQINRLMSRDQIDREYALMKIESQMSLETKKEKASFVIDNSYSILETKRDFLTILEKLEVN